MKEKSRGKHSPEPGAPAGLQLSVVDSARPQVPAFRSDGLPPRQPANQGHAPQLRESTPCPVEFYLSAPEAKTVQLAGDFTRWEQSAVEMTRVGDGVWKASVPISAGRHSYRLIVDGQWREDPCGVLREPNPFGSYNTVIEVR